MFDREKFIAEKIAAATAKGLTVEATVEGRTSRHSFKTVTLRDDFIRRVKLNGGVAKIVEK